VTATGEHDLAALKRTLMPMSARWAAPGYLSIGALVCGRRGGGIASAHGAAEVLTLPSLTSGPLKCHHSLMVASWAFSAAVPGAEWKRCNGLSTSRFRL